jgi:hypothetical protein
MKNIARRELLRGTGVAALAAGAAVVPFVGTRAAGGELAALCRRYWEQVEVFNNLEDLSDDESDAHAAATFECTVRLMIGVPARNAEDALAALDWLIKESTNMYLVLNDTAGDAFDPNNDLDCLTVSLVRAVRGYIASTTEVRS